MVELYRYTNLSCIEISKIFKVSDSFLRNILNGKTYKSVTGGKVEPILDKKYKYMKLKPNKISNEKELKINDIFNMRNNGKSLKEIAEKHKMSISGVSRIVNGNRCKNFNSFNSNYRNS